jgi:peroxiredoxin Q/BCP
MLQEGEKAPSFRADSTQGRMDLDEHLGKRPIVLIFYPKDNTPVCTRQLCAVRDASEAYARSDALVLGINPGSCAEHREFAGKFGYRFPLISDEGGRINRLYRVGRMPILPFLGQNRIVFVIGKDGRIVYARKGNRPTKEILQAVEKASAT